MTTALAALESEPVHHINENFGWDFWTTTCRLCGGDLPRDEAMPEGWTNAGHKDECPVPGITAEFARQGKLVQERGAAIHEMSVAAGYHSIHRDPIVSCPSPICVEDRLLDTAPAARGGE